MSEPLVRTVRVGCGVEHAWRTFTTQVDMWWPRGHRRFASSTLAFERSVGGRFLERAADGQEALLGEVQTWDPPGRLVYTWYPGAISEPTTVEITFAPDATGTVVTVVHSEGAAALGDAWSSRVTRFVAGWTAVLAAFEEAV